MYTASGIAKYIIWKSHQDGEPVSNLKLQKLLYYVQGFGLAVFNQPVFEEGLYAWALGPVVPQVWAEYKDYGSTLIPTPDESVIELDPHTKELIDEVYSVYGAYTATALKNMTHQEPPWMGTAQSEEISPESMRTFFKTRLVD